MESKLRKSLIVAFFSIGLTSFISCSTFQKKENDIKLWYDQPAKVIKNEKKDSKREWLNALPIANGSLGLMVFGDVNRERIQLILLFSA